MVSWLGWLTLRQGTCGWVPVAVAPGRSPIEIAGLALPSPLKEHRQVRMGLNMGAWELCVGACGAGMPLSPVAYPVNNFGNDL